MSSCGRSLSEIICLGRLQTYVINCRFDDWFLGSFCSRPFCPLILLDLCESLKLQVNSLCQSIHEFIYVLVLPSHFLLLTHCVPIVAKRIIWDQREYVYIDDRPTCNDRLTTHQPRILKILNGDISTMCHPIHFKFGSSIWFSGTANFTASFKLTPGCPLLPWPRSVMSAFSTLTKLFWTDEVGITVKSSDYLTLVCIELKACFRCCVHDGNDILLDCLKASSLSDVIHERDLDCWLQITQQRV